MKCLPIIISSLFILILLSVPLQAGVILAGSCERDSVQAAIDKAYDGDTVLVPAGTGIWNSAVTIGRQLTWGENPTFESKQIVLQGAGKDRTIIINSGSYGGTLLSIIGVADKFIRVTGFTFKGVLRQSTTWPAINLNGKIWRIDHCKFDCSDITPWQQGRGLIVSGRGIIDHCDFLNSYQSIAPFGDGDASWNRALTPGTADAVYVEDCNITNTEPFDGAVDSYNGSRYIFRHNKVVNEIIGHHGRDSGGYRSVLWFEYYNNIFISTLENNIWVAANFRGGTGVMFNNSWNGKYGNIRIVYYCAIPGNPSCGWSECTEYPCIDQTGRGPDMDYDGVQDLVPLYEWHNTKNEEDIDIDVEEYSSYFIQDGRDYYSDTFKPSYVPYPYPHPLTLQNPAGKVFDLDYSISDSSIELNWNSIDSADSYRILRNWEEIGSGTTGTSFSDETPVHGTVYMVYAIRNSDNKIFAAEGVIIGNNSGVNIIEGPVENPQIFKLYQNYPNPFNPTTVISYKLKVRSEVGLKIYDILGREIITLISGVKDAGDHAVEWNGKNSAGRQVGSGVYFYQISTKKGFLSTKKMILLK